MAYKYFNTIILPVRRNIQDTAYDCGPASLKIILETIDREFSEENLIKICKTTPKFGTNPQALEFALKKLEVKHETIQRASIKIVENKIRKLNLCVINYQAWGKCGQDYKNLETGHYSVIFGFNHEHLYIADPHKNHTEKHNEWGFRTIDKKLLCERWKDKFLSNGETTYHWMIAVPIVQKYCSVLKRNAFD